MKTFWLILVLLISPAAGFAADCSYCAEMKRIEEGFSQVKPDPMNAKTIDRQNALVDDGVKVLAQAFRNGQSADFERVIPFFALVIRYDYQNLAAEQLVPVLGDKTERFFATLKTMERAGRVRKEDARNIRIAVGTAEGVREQGTDPKAPKKKSK